MNNDLEQALASAEFEGFAFTDEQKEFMVKLVESVDSGTITWDEAIQLVKARLEARRDANKRRETDN